MRPVTSAAFCAGGVRGSGKEPRPGRVGVGGWEGTDFQQGAGLGLWPPCRPQAGFLRFSSVAQSCPTLCDPMNCSTPGLPVHHQLLELAQTHVRVGDAIQPSHPLSSTSPLAFNISQHQGLFQRVSFSHHAVKVLEFQL